jgi:RimJ/RimL family protein N-acetyltransferase
MERTGPDPLDRNTHRIVTHRLDIAPPHPSDAAELYRLVGGEHRVEVCATLVWDGPERIGDVEEWIARCASETYGSWGFHWVIRDRDGFSTRPGRAIGAIGSRPRGSPGRDDVGYWLGRPYWGNGVITEALRALLAFGFDELRYAKIEAEVFTTNQRGLRFVEGVGMRREGTIRRAVRKRGMWVDEAVHGMLPEEFRPSDQG